MPDPAVARRLPDGRLHLQHGPIDLVVEAFGTRDAVAGAYRAAARCFPAILPALVGELAVLRAPIRSETPNPRGPVARRMASAVRPHLPAFVTPMAAVAGAVADHVLAAMTADRHLVRAYVNNGGDIALHLDPGERLVAGMVGRLDRPRPDGRIVVDAAMPVRGVATSGRAGRSFSLGIADAVTVLAPTAAAADAAATLIANAVDTDHDRIERAPARDLDPDSDLGDLPVTVAVGALDPAAVDLALRRGAAAAEAMRRRGLIHGAVMVLRGRCRVVGTTPIALANAA